ncbi:hypothetical protein [Leclercia sp. GLN_9]|uniref:hypothetical protein n=1 Tax=Leclercia sp. GLN_9 TaxID=3367184 RepID=UPI003709DF6B
MINKIHNQKEIEQHYQNAVNVSTTSTREVDGIKIVSFWEEDVEYIYERKPNEDWKRVPFLYEKSEE